MNHETQVKEPEVRQQVEFRCGHTGTRLTRKGEKEGYAERAASRLCPSCRDEQEGVRLRRIRRERESQERQRERKQRMWLLHLLAVFRLYGEALVLTPAEERYVQRWIVVMKKRNEEVGWSPPRPSDWVQK